MDFETVSYDVQNNALVIIDQTLLPGETVFLTLTTVEQAREAICALRVRGAPAIGVAAAIAYAVAAQNIQTNEFSEFSLLLSAVKDCLATSRPTAVNLFWALDRMEQVLTDNPGAPIVIIKKRLQEKALEIKQEDVAVCRKIGENGAALLGDGFGILTHCNAGRLAAVQYGTALAPIYVGTEQGKKFNVFADETRPLLQGARLTAWELNQAGIDVTVLCDNMAASLMHTGKINAVIVGAARIAANGDTANKIGTSGLAILAKHYGIPFYVAAPTSTLDQACATGADIKIEHRQGTEVTELWYKKPMAPKGIGVYNPAFDVTDHTLITAIITEFAVHHNTGGAFSWQG
ncbi:MAG: S-methyl-5-thioribose-1-phosphate isomerase [Clostridiales bacterium]|nr:S-methyl-5-thioribose-1-phosphate isomerase [Clostridiales bacterium]